MKKLIPFIPVLGMFLVPYLSIKHEYDLGIDKPIIFITSSIVQSLGIAFLLSQILN